MNFYNQQKKSLVSSVFNKVHKKYDFMNDLMSLGIHRFWKKDMIHWMKPHPSSSLIDVASGTGDIAKIFAKKTFGKSKISCVEPNEEMLSSGKKKLAEFRNITWHCSSAENLPFEDNKFDFYTISFGIRNVTNIDLSLREAYRVLKSGGRFMCLEFSKIENEILKNLYKKYSKIIPLMGKYVVGNSMPYEYLVESIERFYNQKELSKKLKDNGFSKVEFRNLSNGISAIHSGWKI